MEENTTQRGSVPRVDDSGVGHRKQGVEAEQEEQGGRTKGTLEPLPDNHHLLRREQLHQLRGRLLSPGVVLAAT